MDANTFMDRVLKVPGIVKESNGRRHPNITVTQEFLTEDGNVLLVAVSDLGPALS